MTMSLRHRMTRTKCYFFEDPEGKIHNTRLLKEFCALHELSVKQMRRLAREVISHHRGWTLVKVSEKYNRSNESSDNRQ